MYKLKNVSKLGDEITYNIERKRPSSTSDITIYHDTVLNIWDGTIIEYGDWRDLEDDEIVDIIKEVVQC